MKKLLLILAILGFTVSFLPYQGMAFEKAVFDNGQELTVWGYLRNNTGVFTQNPNPWGAYDGQSGNRLAVMRTWLRGSMDWKISDQFRFWIVAQFAYEPWLKVEQGNSIAENGGYQVHRKSGWKTYSEYDDINDVLREVYFEWRPNKKTTFKFGRMNVIWGETLTGRVGDVVNPMDIRWNLPMSGEATDDQRIPQYMIRGMHDIECLSSSFEWIISPILTASDYSVTRAPSDPANVITGNAGQRFSPAPQTYFDPTGSVGNPFLGTWGALVVPDYAMFADVNAMSTSPMNGAWSFNTIFANIFTLGHPGTGWVPFTFTTVPGLGVVAPVGESTPIVRVKLPDGFDDTRFGFRTNTNYNGYSFGLIYYHRQVFEPVMSREAIANVSVVNGMFLLNRRYYIEYPDIDNIGMYMSKQLPWPGVIRTEVMYTPNYAFNEFVPVAQPFSTETGVVKRDMVQYLFAYDLRGFLYFDWHKTAPFDIIFEHIGTWIPNARELQNATITWYGSKIPSYRAQLLTDISTNWLYDRFETGITIGYQTWGNCWMITPKVKWLPGFLNKRFTAELKYVYLDGDRDKDVFGIWKDKSYVYLQTQFNF